MHEPFPDVNGGAKAGAAMTSPDPRSFAPLESVFSVCGTDQ
ncbi:hypothetical protein GFS60_05262 [Rhodococcus sp. WAY2]|nr:hypothetical protein GFS60_05262 [Rhodococcus sp. WAY2]